MAYADRINQLSSPDKVYKTALVVGAGFAGLSASFWLNRLGYAVTVVEIGTGIKRGGTPVDIKEGTVDIIRAMGLFDRVWGGKLPTRPMIFKDASGNVTVQSPAQTAEAQEAAGECEIERDTLLDMLFATVRQDTEFVFGDTVAALADRGDHVAVDFKRGQPRNFSLVVGCDGVHSAIRRMQFGHEENYSFFLQNYFGLSVVDRLLIAPQSSEIHNVAGKAMMLNSYDGKTDVAFTFRSEAEIAYDHRSMDAQKDLLASHFAEEPWATQMLQELLQCDNFYFDKFCQIRMSTWSLGRVVLVGDAGYCASPAAGMGGSLAIVGAYHLGMALSKYPDDLDAAFKEYDAALRPFVSSVQQGAVEFGLQMFAPSTEEAILERNAALG